MTTLAATIRLIGDDLADCNRATAALREQLLDATSELSIERVKDDKSTQDIGTTLALVFGTPVLVAIASGIADFIRSRSPASTIKLNINGNYIELQGSIANHPSQVQQLVELLQAPSNPKA